MTRPKKPVPAAPRAPLTLEERARQFIASFDPALKSWPVYEDAVRKLLVLFANELLQEVERCITDQHAHPDKLSRLYWQARMDAGREIHELRRGRGGA